MYLFNQVKAQQRLSRTSGVDNALFQSDDEAFVRADSTLWMATELHTDTE